MKHLTSILTASLVLMSTALAHPGHPGHEDWPFDAISWSSSMIAVSIVVIGWTAFRLLQSRNNTRP